MSHIQAHSNWPLIKDTDWHLDHIFPVKAFVERGITDISLICCLKNLQPLSSEENMVKGDRYDSAAFEQWLADFGPRNDSV